MGNAKKMAFEGDCSNKNQRKRGVEQNSEIKSGKIGGVT